MQYIVVRESLASIEKAGAKAGDKKVSQDILSGIEGQFPGAEVVNVSVLDTELGVFAYATLRIPEVRKAGSKV
jgi:hypothetical protein